MKKIIFSLLVSVISPGVQAAELGWMTLDSENLRSFSVDSEGERLATLNISFVGASGQQVHLNGKYTIIEQWARIGYPCKADEMKNIDILTVHAGAKELTSWCEFASSFSLNNLKNPDLSLLQIGEYLESVRLGEYDEVAQGNVDITNNQSIHGGNASSASSSSSMVLNNAASVRSAQAQGGISVSSSRANARTSADGNKQSATNVGINTVRSCARVTPTVRVQYLGSEIKNISFSQKSRLMACP